MRCNHIMDNQLIKSIVRCAFKICFYYLLKWFLPSTIDSGAGSLPKYEAKLMEQINILKMILQTEIDPGSGSGSDSGSGSGSGSLCTESIGSTNTENTEYNSESLDSETKRNAYEKIKDNITAQLKEKYGTDTYVEFNVCDDESKDDMICALKIKEMGKNDPNPEKYGKSDIYVNTKTKTFQIRTSDGFQSFPLGKKSIVRCEKSIK